MAKKNQDGTWTLTAEEALYADQRRQTADFADSIFNDPKLNKQVKAIIKQKYPDLPIPDYDMEASIDARFAERDKKENDARAAAAKADDDARFKDLRAQTQKQYGLTDEAMERMEKMMIERNIGDYDAAATYFATKEPKTSEANWDETRWHHEKTEGWGELAKDPEAWGRNEILKAIRNDQANARGGR
jgi:hypothetical protein